MKRGNLNLLLLLLVALIASSCTTVRVHNQKHFHCKVDTILYKNGGIIKLSDNSWAEKRARKSIAYKQFHVDESSIYLHAVDSRDQLVINLKANTLKYCNENQPNSYEVKSISAVNKLKGWNLSEVKFPRGSFVQTEDSKWVEKRIDGAVAFHFKETHRDEWSVYLYDASRKVRIQLDIWTKKIMYSDPKKSFFLYPIILDTKDRLNP
ncbi:MAG: hypothetical protein NE330_14630 [Lentisphaeraceae bacterium]|nr:hypothetical protein [Lentisphaeraceae bacterium]